jgi:hypothetical protein
MNIKDALLAIAPTPIKNYYVKNIFTPKQYKSWVEAGKPIPVPHAAKQNVINEFRDQSNYSVLVETGTYLGDMVEAQRTNFGKIYSVELSEELHKKAVNRFKNHSHISILQGDSSKVLYDVVKDLKQPAIFWLDGHYSAGVTARGDKDCPVYEELGAIKSGENLPHIILIDDARCFVGENDYPTVEALTEYVKTNMQGYTLSIADDVIRLLPENFS